MVEHVPERARTLAPVEAAKDFEVALGHFVQQQVTRQVDGAKSPQVVAELLLLGLLQVGQQRAHGPHQLGLVFDVKGTQIGHALGFQHLLGGRPQVEVGLVGKVGDLNAKGRKMAGRGLHVGQQQLARGKLLCPLPQLGLVAAVQARPFARGKLYPGQAACPRGVFPEEGAEVIAALGVEVGVFHHGARSEHPDHLALDQSLGQLGVFHLVADGHLVAFLQQLRQVAGHGVVRHPAHGHGRAGILVA